MAVLVNIVGPTRVALPSPFRAGSFQSRREISDRLAQFIVFQIKKCLDQARAMGGKRHFDEGWCFDFLVLLSWLGVRRKNTERQL